MLEIYYTKCYLGHNHDWNVGATSNVRKTSFNQYECSAKMTYHKGLNKTITRIISVLRQILNEIIRQMLGTDDSYSIFSNRCPLLDLPKKTLTYHRNYHMKAEAGRNTMVCTSSILWKSTQNQDTITARNIKGVIKEAFFPSMQQVKSKVHKQRNQANHIVKNNLSKTS